MMEGCDPSSLGGGEGLVCEKANRAVGGVGGVTSPSHLPRKWGVGLSAVKRGKSWSNWEEVVTLQCAFGV